MAHHGHAHSHAHNHGHSHAPKDFGRAFALGVALNAGFVLVEAAVGLRTGSLALLADAGHNLSDVLGLLLAWGAVILARRAPNSRRTYGLRKATILASLGNAALLLTAVGAIASEAFQRLFDPAVVATGPVMATAMAGVVINGATAMLFLRGQEDLNVRAAFLHMATDAGLSLAVVAGAVLMQVSGGLAWVDPLLSLAICAVILIGSWGVLKDSMNLALDAAPRGVDVNAVRSWLTAQAGVTEVHDLHVWAMSTTETALTAHLVRPANTDPDAFLHTACEELAHRFGIGHVTLQVETGDAAHCRLFPADAV